MAGAAQGAFTRGAGSVLAHEVWPMHHMTFRQTVFRLQVHVATIAIGHLPLLFVLMTGEASGHRRTQRAILCTHIHMTADAIAFGGIHVGRMLELEVLARHGRLLTQLMGAMALVTRVWIVRLFVATHAVVRIGQMHRALLARRVRTFVTLKAMDAVEHMGPVLERFFLSGLDAEHRRTSHEARCANQEKQCTYPHMDPTR